VIVIQVEYTGIFSPPAVKTGEAALVSPANPPTRATVNLAIPTLSSSSKDPLKDSEFKSMEVDRSVGVSRMLGLKIRTIMIDAGHGGSDSGTRGKMGTLEKDLTLDIARRLRAHLMKHGGAQVLMTREGDYYIPLTRRVELARQSRADLFISVHLNYLPSKPINMIETYYFGPSDDQKIIALAEQENAGSEYGLSDFRDIVEKLGGMMKLQESRELARSIQGTLFLNSRRHNEDVQNYGVKRAPFVVLVGVDVPAVLAEVSCLSNTEEERELNSERHRDNIARYLAAGISAYLDKGALTHEARH
jgi:N-acetylmuramoyl-L-alanine amidase